MNREVWIVSAARTAVGRAKRGTLVNVRPDDMAAVVLNEVINRAPGVEKSDVQDVILGNSFPEHTQGMNFARIAVMLAGFPYTVPGQTVNRFCSSGLQAIAIGAQEILTGMSDVVIAGGSESMSQVPMAGYNFAPNPLAVEDVPEIYISMGLTAENVADKYKVSREDQDAFGFKSNQKALAANASGRFKDEIVPLTVKTVQVGPSGKIEEKTRIFQVDEGPRATTLEQMAALKPAFKVNGSVTAGNSSQMSDGAAAGGIPGTPYFGKAVATMKSATKCSAFSAQNFPVGLRCCFMRRSLNCFHIIRSAACTVTNSHGSTLTNALIVFLTGERTCFLRSRSI